MHKRLGRFSANLSKHFTVSISKNKEPRKKVEFDVKKNAISKKKKEEEEEVENRKKYIA